MVSLSVTLNIGILQNIDHGFRRSLAHDKCTIHILQCQIEIKIIVSRVENLKSNSDRIIEGQRQTVAEFGQITSERSGSSQEKDIIHSSIIQDYHN